MIKSCLGVLALTCAIGLASLFPCAGPAFAAEGASSYGKLDATVVKKVEWELRSLAKKFSEQGKLDKETLFAMLTNYLWKNPEIFGAAFAFVPELKDGKEIKSAPYLYRNGDQLIQKDLSTSYDYTAPEHKWYAKPVKTGKASWSEPYLDKGGGDVWMVTYSIPVYTGGKERQLVGVATSDVALPAAP